jgi:hypothetical protein
MEDDFPYFSGRVEHFSTASSRVNFLENKVYSLLRPFNPCLAKFFTSSPCEAEKNSEKNGLVTVSGDNSHMKNEVREFSSRKKLKKRSLSFLGNLANIS